MARLATRSVFSPIRVVARPTDVVRYRRTAEAQCRAHPAVD